MFDEWSAWRDHHRGRRTCAARMKDQAAHGPRDLRGVLAVEGAPRDVAGFGATDDPALVVAAFSCQFCLWAADLVLLDVRSDPPAAWAICASCEAYTEIGLTAAQLQRLQYAAPRSMAIRAVSGLPIGGNDGAGRSDEGESPACR